MEISEIKITKYLTLEEGVVTKLQRDFLAKSDEYVDELFTFADSIEALIEWTVWEDKDKSLTSFFRDMVLDIGECILSVEDNSSLVRKSIPSDLQIKAVIKHRLIVLMFVRSCFSILQKSVNSK
tara:strand:+ start:2700 stop:3071 length:372 start_codon:yes stop_codon:yes gene_type:complete